jgi:hypothetical protein
MNENGIYSERLFPNVLQIILLSYLCLLEPTKSFDKHQKNEILSHFFYLKLLKFVLGIRLNTVVLFFQPSFYMKITYLVLEAKDRPWTI